MKKGLKLIGILISLVLGITSVSATDFSTDNGISYNRDRDKDYGTTIQYHSASKFNNHSANRYTLNEKNGDGSSFTGYCLDPQLSAGYSDPFKISRVLGEGTTVENAMDAGIVAILKDTYTSTGYPSKSKYAATETALRTLTIGMYGYTLNDVYKTKADEMITQHYLVGAYVDLAATWISGSSSNTNKANKIFGTNYSTKEEFKSYFVKKFGSYLLNNYKTGLENGYFNNISTDSTLRDAKTIFEKGLNAVYQYELTGTGEAKVTQNKGEIIGTSGNVKVVQVKYTVKNLPSTIKSTFNYECLTSIDGSNTKTCEELGYKIRKAVYSVDGVRFSNITSDTNILAKAAASGNRYLYVRYTVETPADGICKSIYIKNNLKYEDENGIFKGAIFVYNGSEKIESFDGSGKSYMMTNFQRFVALQKKKDLNDKLELIIPLCEETPYCVKNEGSCYVCTTDKFDKENCEKTDCNEALKIPNIKDVDNQCAQKYCVKTPSTGSCNICTTEYYDADHCKSTSCSTALSTPGIIDRGCEDTPTYCVKRNGVCYVTTNPYSTTGGTRMECSEAIRRADYNYNCNACSTEISSPTCSYNQSDAHSDIKGPDNIKVCLLDNGVDDAGNTYRLTTGGTVSASNPYCRVYCKEDVSIDLNPKEKEVTCGTYFSLTGETKATKTCYTTGMSGSSHTADYSMSEDAFKSNMARIQSEMVRALNLYKYYEAASTITQTSYRTNNTTVGCAGMDPFRTSLPIINYKYGKTSYEQYVLRSVGNGLYTVARGANQTLSGGTLTSSWNARDCEMGFDADKAYSNMVTSYSNGLSSAASRLSALIDEYNSHIAWYNECSTWSNKYDSTPKIGFTYNEYNNSTVATPYNSSAMGYLEPNGSASISSSVEICTGSINDSYKCSVATTSSIPTKTLSFVKCSTSGCSNVSETIYSSKYIKKTITKDQKYVTPTEYYQIEGTGIITSIRPTNPAIGYESLVHGLPVSEKATGGGVFHMYLQNIGEFYDKNEAGRLMDINGTNQTKSVAYKLNRSNPTSFDGDYVCNYETPCTNPECPNCEFICEEGKCEWVECPTCEFLCSKDICLFEGGKLNINPKTITSSDVTSANRKYGYNWLIEAAGIPKLELLSKKASATIAEIEKYNETIYNNVEAKIGTSEGLAFSIKLTPEVTRMITSYNEEQLEYGGYANDSITCYDAKIGGVTYKNIYCFSDFIDTLIEKGAEIVVPNTRVPATSRSDNNNAANNGSINSYWTLWSDYSVYADNDTVIGGPAWK